MDKQKIIQVLKTCDSSDNFEKVSNYLFTNCCIKVRDETYRFAEIEFYVYNKNHPDIFTHRHPNQQKMFSWYFHQMSKTTEHSYKQGTYKCIDLSCGQNGDYVGILIRSIIKASTNKYIEGPCNIVNEFLSTLKCDNIKNVVCDLLKNNLDAYDNDLFCVRLKQYQGEPIFKSPRIGLTLKKLDIDLKAKYIGKLYRHIIFPENIIKGKKMIILTALHEQFDKKILAGKFKLSNKKINDLDNELEIIKKNKIVLKKDWLNDYIDKSNLNDSRRIELFIYN